MKKLNDLITLARSEEGYIEKASNKNLDSKTTNKGDGNYTKYSRDIDLTGLSGCQGEPWCCTHQFWLEAETFGLKRAGELEYDEKHLFRVQLFRHL